MKGEERRKRDQIARLLYEGGAAGRELAELLGMGHQRLYRIADKHGWQRPEGHSAATAVPVADVLAGLLADLPPTAVASLAMARLETEPGTGAAALYDLMNPDDDPADDDSRNDEDP